MVLDDGNFRKLDMRIHPEDDQSENDSTTKGELCWDILPEHKYNLDWYHANSWDFYTVNVRVQKLHGHVRKRHLDEYSFKRVGDDYVGCRFWV